MWLSVVGCATEVVEPVQREIFGGRGHTGPGAAVNTGGIQMDTKVNTTGDTHKGFEYPPIL